MKAMRYIITRPDLQEGSLRILKYMEAAFPHSGPAHFLDDRGEQHAVQVDREHGRILGLAPLFRAQNLGVNDVLHITPLPEARYQAEATVKPYTAPPAQRAPQPAAPETRRVIVASTPHVREIRTQALSTPESADQITPTPAQHQGQTTESRRSESRVGESRLGEPGPSERRPAAPERTATDQPRSSRHQPRLEARAATAPRPPEPAAPRPHATAQTTPTSTVIVATTAPEATERRAPAAPMPWDGPHLEAGDTLGLLEELARLTGYRTQYLGGVTRLVADLGAHGYSVLVAHEQAALSGEAWQENADYRVLLTDETQRPEGTPRLTREALVALIEHARLAPLSPVELRGYWKAGNIDLESAASVAELVGAHLAQRGAFSFVLLTLAQQPAHSVVSVQRLAERLGSGVNYAELGSILETLTRAPFLALTPLPGGQYLLRVGVPDLLADLAEYAGGVSRRIRTPLRETAPA